MKLRFLPNRILDHSDYSHKRNQKANKKCKKILKQSLNLVMIVQRKERVSMRSNGPLKKTTNCESSITMQRPNRERKIQFNSSHTYPEMVFNSIDSCLLRVILLRLNGH